jgi:Family of unknown function (DUF6152)
MRRSRLLLLLAALGFGLIATPAGAHHSMATYDQTTLVPIKGTVTGIEWLNPHCWVTLSVQSADGRTVTQRIELAGPNGLQKKGFTKGLLNVGDSVTIEAWLSKDARISTPNGRWITFADGRRFDVGDNWTLRGTQPR